MKCPFTAFGHCLNGTWPVSLSRWSAGIGDHTLGRRGLFRRKGGPARRSACRPTAIAGVAVALAAHQARLAPHLDSRFDARDPAPRPGSASTLAASAPTRARSSRQRAITAGIADEDRGGHAGLMAPLLRDSPDRPDHPRPRVVRWTPHARGAFSFEADIARAYERAQRMAHPAAMTERGRRGSGREADPIRGPRPGAVRRQALSNRAGPPPGSFASRR